MRRRPLHRYHEEAESLTLAQRQWCYRRQLHLLNHIGMLEPAFYAYLPPEVGRRPYLDWHYHGLVWGTSRSKLEQRCTVMRKQLASFLPGITAIDVRPVHPPDLRHVMWYIDKSPCEQLSVSRKAQPARNRYSYRQGAAKLSGVNAVRLYAATRDFYIDRLSLAGGEGSDLLGTIKRRSLLRFRNARRAGRQFF